MPSIWMLLTLMMIVVLAAMLGWMISRVASSQYISDRERLMWAYVGGINDCFWSMLFVIALVLWYLGVIV